MPKAAEAITCLVTKEAYSKHEMLRFVISPDGWLMHDITGKLPVEGCYVHAQPGLVGEAIERGLFKRALRKPHEVEEDFEALVASHLYQRVLEGISMARKAGCAVNGFDKCLQAVQSDAVEVMLHADDAADHGVKKLSPGNTAGDKAFEIVRLFSRKALSEAIGGENVAHIAILKGEGSAFFLKQLRRFTLFSGKTPL